MTAKFFCAAMIMQTPDTKHPNPLERQKKPDSPYVHRPSYAHRMHIVHPLYSPKNATYKPCSTEALIRPTLMLDRMMQNPPQTHPPCPLLLMPSPSLPVLPLPQPPLP